MSTQSHVQQFVCQQWIRTVSSHWRSRWFHHFFDCFQSQYSGCVIAGSVGTKLHLFFRLTPKIAAPSVISVLVPFYNDDYEKESISSQPSFRGIRHAISHESNREMRHIREFLITFFLHSRYSRSRKGEKGGKGSNLSTKDPNRRCLLWRITWFF